MKSALHERIKWPLIFSGIEKMLVRSNMGLKRWIRFCPKKKIDMKGKIFQVKTEDDAEFILP